MAEIKIRRTYKYQVYRSRKTEYLDEIIEVARQIWNHCLALQKRYYKLCGKYIPANRLKTFVAKLRRRKFPEWKKLGSQAVQDVVERLDRSYSSFFDWCKTKSGPRKSPPKFKKRGRYRSFTLKQAGWSIEGNHIRIIDKTFSFWLHRPFGGTVKTVTVKCMPNGDYFIFLSVEEEVHVADTHTGKAVGIDFGLKTFLTLSDGTKIESPQWMLRDLDKLRKASRNLSSKKNGSKNRKRALHTLENLHQDVSNRRTDWFFKTARSLTLKYSVICIEDLNLSAMQRLWERKISDLAFGEFVKILEYEALMNGCEIVKIGRWYPSSKACHICGTVNSDLQLKDRAWICPSCGVLHDRDVNAAINILNEGLRLQFGKSAAS